MHRKQNGYRSIHGKLLNALIFSWCLCMLFFALYYLLSTRADAFRQYERRTRADAEVTATNIDYYLGNTVSATKSIYFDQQLLQRVMADTAGYQTTEVRRDLFTYLHTISLTMPYAEQIYLAIPRQGVSVLYIPSTLRLSFNADEPYSLEEPIRMLTLYDTYLQPTHEMDTYGHIVSFSTPTEKTLVFTIWLPISNIPWSLASEAYVAIDIPLEFIMNNCQIDEENGELVYIVDSSGFIIASNLPEAVMQNADALDLPPGILDEETVVLLSKGEVDSKKIRVEFSLEDMDMSEFQDGATYPQIKEYVLEHTGLKVSNLYISQIKRKCGIGVGKNYNLPKSEDSRQPQCPQEKEKAIREAFKYFGMI